MAIIDKDQVTRTYGGMQSDNTVPGAENRGTQPIPDFRNLFGP